MTPNLDDTQPVSVPEGLAAPPRILLWGVIVLFLMGVIGTFAGIYIFREVLKPGQQQRVIDNFEFMEALLPPRPDPSDTVPTAVATVDEGALQNLLQLDLPPAAEETEAAATSLPTNTPLPTITPLPTNTPLPTITPLPTVTAAPTAGQTPVADVAFTREWPINARNYGFTWHKQTWNNCGPANITMALSYYGWQEDQTYAARYLKPNREDKNVSPSELVSFVNEQTQVRALTRIGGDLDLLRTLIANEFPVIVERSQMFEGYDWIGHYQTVVAYNDSEQRFYSYDSFLGDGDGTGVTDDYEDLDHHWQAFNRAFIVVYDPVRENRLLSLLGERADPLQAAEHAFDVAQQEARANPQNGFAWFNMGSSLTELGRYQEAAVAFDEAFRLGIPWRMLWYQFGPFEAYYQVGRYEDVLNYVNNNLTNGGEYVEETYYWQGRVYEAMGRTSEAASAFRTALNRNNLFTRAQVALDRLNS